MSNNKITTENDNSHLLNNKLKRDQEVNDEYTFQNKIKASIQIPSNFSKEDNTNNINFNETLDEVLSRRKQEAVDKYNQYKNTNEFEYLIQSIAKDNTNSDILYEYLNYLSKSNPTEFAIQYKWRRLFLKREHMILLKGDDLYSIDPIEKILIHIFEQINSYSNTEDWLQNTKILIKEYQISNPYCLKFLNNSFLFTTSRKKELDNIKAWPYSISKTTAYTYNNKIFPIIEYYTCTEEEKKAFANKIAYNGMTVGVIDRIINYAGNTWSYKDITDKGYIKARLIRVEGIDDDTNLLNSLADEVFKGFYTK